MNWEYIKYHNQYRHLQHKWESERFTGGRYYEIRRLVVRYEGKREKPIKGWELWDKHPDQPEQMINNPTPSSHHPCYDSLKEAQAAAEKDLLARFK